MRKYQYTEKGFTFERVDKKTARTAYINGLSVVACPVNLRPGAPWHPEAVLNRKDRVHLVIDEIGVKNDFNNMIASFEFYNCRNAETGKYTAFISLLKSLIASQVKPRQRTHSERLNSMIIILWRCKQ